MRVLLLEDHADLRLLLQCHLQQLGAEVDAVERGEAALAAAAEVRYDAILLDLGLPDLDGLDVIRRLRGSIDPEVPILVLSARHSTEEKVIGLDAGADDYLGKPFDLLELDARLRSILRRTPNRPQPALSFLGLRLDPVAREASASGQMFPLTRREATLLGALLTGQGHTLVRDVLEDRCMRWTNRSAAMRSKPPCRGCGGDCLPPVPESRSRPCAASATGWWPPVPDGSLTTTTRTGCSRTRRTCADTAIRSIIMRLS